MKEETRKRKFYKAELQRLLELDEDAHNVKNRYRVMLFLISKEYPSLLTSTSKESLKEMLKDAVYIDRQIRYFTEGEDEDEKLELAQEVAQEVRTGTY